MRTNLPVDQTYGQGHQSPGMNLRRTEARYSPYPPTAMARICSSLADLSLRKTPSRSATATGHQLLEAIPTPVVVMITAPYMGWRTRE